MARWMHAELDCCWLLLTIVGSQFLIGSDAGTARLPQNDQTAENVRVLFRATAA